MRLGVFVTDEVDSKKSSATVVPYHTYTETKDPEERQRQSELRRVYSMARLQINCAHGTANHETKYQSHLYKCVGAPDCENRSLCSMVLPYFDRSESQTWTA